MKIGSYEVAEKIGEGGMGEVYRARDPKLGRDVAIKVLPKSVADNPERLQRFEQEARAAGSLNHPNIVTVYELGADEGTPYMVMELVEGESLREKTRGVRLASRETVGASGTGSAPSSPGTPQEPPADAPGAALPVRKAIDYGVQIAHGLAAAHERGIAHRDLKPENILITPDGQAKILDFGLAKLISVQADDATATQLGPQTSPGTVMGTVGYMSPEQVRGREADHRADIFSLGTILYEMLSGRRAFHADSSVGTMNAILTEDPPLLTSQPSGISPVLDRIVRRCLEKEPGERFQSGHDLAFALQAVADASGAETAVAAPAAVESNPWKVVGALVAGAIFVSMGVWIGRNLVPPAANGAGGAAAAATMTQLTFEQGEEYEPTIAPDGRSFVFVADDGGLSDLYLQRVGGETAINLTVGTEENDDFHPAFSPDGESIAFVSDRDGGGIFVMGATGESVRRLTDFGFNPAWSPDGKSLVLSTEAVFDPTGRTTVASLHVVDVASGEMRELDTPDAVQPAWSPNDRRIAYWGLPPGTGQRVISTVPVEGGDPVPLTDDAFFNWNPQWSADGRYLYFSSNRSGQMNLWRLPIDEASGQARGPAEPVTASSEWSGQLAVAAGGDRVVYTARRSTWTIEALAVGSGWTFPDEPERLLAGSRNIWDLEPSPDGRSIAFKAADPWEDLFVMAADGSNVRRLTADAFRDRDPTWSGDSKSIFFFSDRSGRYEMWSIGADGGNLTQVTESETAIHANATASPDGRWLAAFGSTVEAWGIYDLSGELPIREIEPFPEPGGDTRFMPLQFSSDGERLLGRAFGPDPGSAGFENRGLMLYDVGKSSFEMLVEGAVFNGDFLPDGSGVVYNEGVVLKKLDLTTRQVQQVGTIPERYRGISNAHLTRAHDRVVYIDQQTESDIWLIEMDGVRSNP